LGSDLGRVTRFVGINLLFTSSPLYDPLVAAPGPGGKRVVHIELFEDDPATIGAKFIDTGFIRRELRRLQPYYAWDVNLDVNQRLDTGAQRAFRIFAGLIDPGPNDCATEFGTPFAALFCYFDANLDRYVPRYGSNDYVGEVFAFNTTDRRMGDEFGLLGYADDNWRDGTQTYIFEFNYPAVRTAGYGFSTTTVHEFGHHIGMSHPHDGYDAELDIDYGPVNEYFFAWSGDESDTVMHYLSLSNGFSHFDRDNMYRWEMAGYLNRANLLLDDVLAHPDAEQVRGQLNNAEEDARQALKSFERWNYLGAAARARRAYERVATAAAELGIMEAPQAKLLMPPRSDVPRFVDPVHIPDAPVPFGGK
jgi:hypothetical protein